MKMIQFRANIFLTLLSILFFAIFLILGVWQLNRAKEKEQLLANLAQQAHAKPISIENLPNNTASWQYRPVNFSGQFLNKKQFLLDNKINQGQVGYEVITPVKIKGLKKLVLLNRGWIPAAQNRTVLPEIKTIFGSQTIHGIIRLPLAKGFMLKTEKLQVDRWPIRIQQIDFQWMEKALNQPVYPFVVLLDQHADHGFVRQWEMVSMQPATHIGYAIQWFSFAGLLIIIYLIMCIRRVNK